MARSRDLLQLPDDFLLGTATAATQIEGGRVASSWHRWADEGRIRDGSHPQRANDHWRRVDTDIELLREIRCHTHRMSVEWARIEPEEGRFDRAALAHYRNEIVGLREAGIVPLVTLHHFANPLWLEDDGGWLDRRVVGRFERYVRRVVAELGDVVCDWVTINEPNVYLAQGFILGEWPPGRRSVVAYLRGARQMIRAHIAAYRAIHETGRALGLRMRVGVAHHLRVLDPGHPVLAPAIARVLDRFLHTLFLEGMTAGKLRFPLLGRLAEAEGDGPWSDFLGVNYYTRDVIRLSLRPKRAFARLDVAAGAPTNDLGWEIYPEGLARVVRPLADRYALPVWITENGTCDARDAFRAQFIRSHLSVVARLVREGVPVERYYHWSLIDNFEWVEGESARFGLVECDYETQRRRVRESGRLYASICRTRSASPGDL